MMAIDRKQIDVAISMQPTCEQSSVIDKVIAERRRIARMRAAAAIRSGDDSPWLVLRVDSGREIVVRDALIEAGIEALVPMKMGPKLRRFHRVLPPKKQPIMVSYILVRCRIMCDAMAGLLTFDHVRSILGGYEKPYLLASDKVNAFNEKAEKGEFDHERPVSIFKGVKRVRIIDGPFAGFTGDVVTGVGRGKGNAVIEIRFMNQPMPMIMPLAFLAPL